MFCCVSIQVHSKYNMDTLFVNIVTSRSGCPRRAMYDKPRGGEGPQPVVKIQESKLTGFLLLLKKRKRDNKTKQKLNMYICY